MREIKFRAWDKIEKQMIFDGKRIGEYKGMFSYLFKESNFEKQVDRIGICLVCPNGIIVVKDQEGNRDYLYYLPSKDRFIVQQYTGLKDKNGKEIYEGDILEQKLYGGLTNRRDVKWFQEQCCFGFKGATYGISDLTEEKATWYEVIGNIYENGDLLK